MEKPTSLKLLNLNLKMSWNLPLSLKHSLEFFAGNSFYLNNNYFLLKVLIYGVRGREKKIHNDQRNSLRNSNFLKFYSSSSILIGFPSWKKTAKISWIFLSIKFLNFAGNFKIFWENRFSSRTPYLDCPESALECGRFGSTAASATFLASSWISCKWFISAAVKPFKPFLDSL